MLHQFSRQDTTKRAASEAPTGCFLCLCLAHTGNCHYQHGVVGTTGKVVTRSARAAATVTEPISHENTQNTKPQRTLRIQLPYALHFHDSKKLDAQQVASPGGHALARLSPAASNSSLSAPQTSGFGVCRIPQTSIKSEKGPPKTAVGECLQFGGCRGLKSLRSPM